MTPREYPFMKALARILNSGQSRAVVLSGEIHDLFAGEDAGGGIAYVPLLELIRRKWGAVKGYIFVTYELNGPIRFQNDADRERVRDAWLLLVSGQTATSLTVQQVAAGDPQRKTELRELRETFDARLSEAIGKPAVAVELLRQMCIASRTTKDGQPLLAEDLIIVIEGIELMIPAGPITSLSDADRHRVVISRDWFEDQGFTEGGDSVILITESRSLLNREIAKLPQIMEVEVPPPDKGERLAFIEWFEARVGKSLALWDTKEAFATLTAGLSIHALGQMLVGATHAGETITRAHAVGKVEEYLRGQLGEDVISFKKPEHPFTAVVGFRRLKQFLTDVLAPRFRDTSKQALPGAAVSGPIGGGKTFIFEALAATLGMVVLELKNIRSKWFGETDIIFERLRRVLEAMTNVLIIVDEADTAFGGVDPETHETERRLTGKLQAMMSDPRLRGRVRWLLMTARIHRLSPDIRRPGRVGNLIIPVTDPEGEDREEFIRWTVEPVLALGLIPEVMRRLDVATQGYSAASFAALRDELVAVAAGRKLAVEEMLAVAADIIPPDIGPAREYQTLQALLNCTRKSLLPEAAERDLEGSREAWRRRIRELEAQGVR